MRPGRRQARDPERAGQQVGRPLEEGSGPWVGWLGEPRAEDLRVAVAAAGGYRTPAVCRALF